MITEAKQNIQESVQQFNNGSISKNALNFFQTLGYNITRQAPLNKPNYAAFKESFIDNQSKFDEKKAMKDEWKYVDLLFQLSKEEALKQTSLFDTKQVDRTVIETYLFFAIELSKKQYSRTELSHITREVNRLFPMPVMILFKYGNSLTLSIINRRLHKRDENKDVLEKVTLIKDIRIDNPHRAHIEILFDLSFDELKNKHGFTNFVELHNAWQKTLDLKELNKQFYQKLFNWYLWALTQVKFPQIRPEEDKVEEKVHQSESLIRLLTRLLFVWFMKEKGLINPALFDVNKLKTILKDFEGMNGNETIYYKAILQNLFFATLNKPIDQRKVIDRGFNPKEYGDPLVYRFDDLFREPENFLSHFKNIPFLNGGLFECLDQKKDKDNFVEIRMDGFSTKKLKQVVLPDKLFFGEYKDIDFSRDYNDKKKNKLTVYGLIDILHQYKFTIEENTPIEEEIALDPELLGKVFENLLASYTPETQTPARKQTGSFYTPREIVNYMVDESLIAYFSGIIEKNFPTFESRLRHLFSYTEEPHKFNKQEVDTLIDAIDNVKVLDPACGSGAFPMGVLQKMIHILHKLDPENKIWFNMVVSNFPAYMQEEVKKRLQKENWNYVRKLGIIQQCIYGVDIQPIATHIAKLRFFISLLVDQTEKPNEPNRGIDPLPNLDFKIVTANTLISAPEPDVVKVGLFENQIDPFFEEFNRLTGQYFSASMPKDKKELKNKIAKLILEKCNEKIRQIESKYESTDERFRGALKEKHKTYIVEKEREIKLWQSYTNLFKYESVGFFEPRYFFPKTTEGFDVVIANPPYVQIKQIPEEDKPYYIKNFKFATGRFNLFYFFIEITEKFTGKNGIASYIVPDRLLLNTQCFDLRNWLLNQQTVIELDSFDESVFDSAVVDSIILFYKNCKNESSEIFAKLNVSVSGINFSDRIKIPISYFTNSPNNQFNLNYTIDKSNLIEKIRVNSKPLGEISDTKDGIIQSKIPDVLFLNKKENKFCQKLLFGKDINKYHLKYNNNWVNYQHDEMMKIELKRGGGGLRLRTKDIFEREKILTRQTADEIIGTFDNGNYYYSNTLHGTAITNKDYDIKFILALLNSKTLTYYYRATTAEGGKVFAQMKIEILRQLPIKYLSNQKSFVTIVDYLLVADLLIKSFFERLIDAMVYELYLPEEIKTAGCEVLKHLANLPELKDDWSNEKRLQTIEKVYKELSDLKHPVSVAIAKMQEVPEVKIIEGKNKE